MVWSIEPVASVLPSGLQARARLGMAPAPHTASLFPSPLSRRGRPDTTRRVPTAEPRETIGGPPSDFGFERPDRFLDGGRFLLSFVQGSPQLRDLGVGKGVLAIAGPLFTRTQSPGDLRVFEVKLGIEGLF